MLELGKRGRVCKESQMAWALGYGQDFMSCGFLEDHEFRRQDFSGILAGSLWLLR